MDKQPIKLHLGCGKNILEGWVNCDAEMDIRKRLPFPDESLHLVFAEHVVEHVRPVEAWGFFREVRRALRPGGAVRVVVPCVDLICDRYDQEYRNFLRRAVKGSDGSLESAMDSIIRNWGHQAVWTTHALEAVLRALNFKVAPALPNESHLHQLHGIDGHGRQIGEHANWVESGVVEGLKWIRQLADDGYEYPAWERQLPMQQNSAH